MLANDTLVDADRVLAAKGKSFTGLASYLAQDMQAVRLGCIGFVGTLMT